MTRKRNVGKEIFDRMQKAARERAVPRIDAPDPKAADVLPGVEVVRNAEARDLVTIGPDHPAWGAVTDEGFDDDWKGSTLSRYLVAIKRGAIVRILPPADALQFRIDLLAGAFANVAAAVKVLGREPSAKVPVRERSFEKTDPARRSVRDVVLELAREVPSRDREALLGLVERKLAEAKL